MNVAESINKLENTLNKLINKNDFKFKITELLSNELLETLKAIENCTSCKDKETDGNDLDKIEKCLAESEEEEEEEKWEEREELNNELFEINIRLNKEILCEGCKGKKIEKLTDKCGNEKIARFLYKCKLNAKYYNVKYIRWIPFDGFKNIEYLAKGGFGEVHKATWINDDYDEMEYDGEDVVLKRIYNNSSDDKIVDILKEVNIKY